MVYVTNDFLNTSHGKIECNSCHQGDPTAFDKENAHKDIIALASDNADVFCGGCHGDIVDNYAHSLHFTQEGYFKRIENRSGVNIKNDAVKLDHFNDECGKCHASCGQCHISRPVSVNGGFIKGHNFIKTPERDNNCIACHGSRVGAEYMGDNANYVPDLHRYKAPAGKCSFCHFADEMHSSGLDFDYRYLDTDMPRCENEDCHTNVENLEEVNEYHKWHWAEKYMTGIKLACQVCHSQEYKNCDGCHTGGKGITGSSYMAFKIAKNKFNLESAARDYDYVTVRHIPIAPDTYDSWNLALPNYNVEPTWKYTTPHNIKRWTVRTGTAGTDGSCNANCHKLTEYYLIKDDLLPYEIDANKDIIMDDEL